MKNTDWAIAAGSFGIMGLIGYGIGRLVQRLRLKRLEKKLDNLSNYFEDLLKSDEIIELTDENGDPLPDFSKMTMEEFEAFMDA